MQVQLAYRPGASVARVVLAPNETCTAEGGAMVAMSGEMNIETTTRQRGGGVWRAVKRMLGGESFFLNHFTPGAAGGEVWLAAGLPGDMEVLTLQPGQGLIVQAGSFVACDQGIEMDASWQGMKTLLSGEALFFLRIWGAGQVILSSFGAIYPIPVNGAYIVDTGHIVAFEETLNFKISKAGKSWVQSWLGGEGLVCRFEGQGTVWAQSHNPPRFGRLLGPELKAR